MVNPFFVVPCSICHSSPSNCQYWYGFFTIFSSIWNLNDFNCFWWRHKMKNWVSSENRCICRSSSTGVILSEGKFSRRHSRWRKLTWESPSPMKGLSSRYENPWSSPYINRNQYPKILHRYFLSASVITLLV